MARRRGKVPAVPTLAFASPRAGTDPSLCKPTVFSFPVSHSIDVNHA
jgi:hypothetical protein